MEKKDAIEQLIARTRDEVVAKVNGESLPGTPTNVEFVMTQLGALFESANALFNLLPNEAKDKINDFHHQHYSLNHCLRWGEQACENIASHSLEVASDN